jgi:hypothetical protein
MTWFSTSITAKRAFTRTPEVVKRLSELAEVDLERLQLWTFARAAADPRPEWGNPLWMDIARRLAP